MARGKGTVYAGQCVECGARVHTLQILKAKKADFRKRRKYCPTCQTRTEMKLKEEKHSS